MRLDVVLAPNLVEESELGGCLCTVVDVLRATSTIVTALVSGATALRPCLNIAEAREGASMMGHDCAVLGGEEKGERIPGFELGNSPIEYLAADFITGKVVFFYTTNGTGAIRRAYAGSGLPVYISALLNLSAASSSIVRAARAHRPRGVVVLCSGRYGKPSAEDLFCAGMLVEKVRVGLSDAGFGPQTTDSANIAISFATANAGRGLDVVTSSEHGRFLQSIGFERDLEFASQLDTYQAVPVFDGDRIAFCPGDTL